MIHVGLLAVLGAGWHFGLARGAIRGRDPLSVDLSIDVNIKLNSSVCCGALSALFNKKVSYPLGLTYINEQTGLDGYWSSQASEVTPTCRFTPTSAQDVATAVAALASGKCQFAVRSGGHTPQGSAANIEDGVTIDLSTLDSVTVNGDQTITSIGPGARWADVYSKLDALSLGTSGGRVSEVGVGGLILGGGLSFFAPRYGLVCDNVVSYEVVLASGRIVTASNTQNKDLWLALKGGNNNFGIVTKYNMKTFKQGKIWGGMVTYVSTPVTLEANLKALYWYNVHSGNGEDDYSTVINTYDYVGTLDLSIIVNYYDNTAAVARPTILSNFTSIPSIADTTRTTNLTDITVELATTSPRGARQAFGTMSFVNNLEMIRAAYDLTQEAFDPYHLVLGFRLSFVLQTVSQAVLRASAAAGGNSLGLDASEGNLVLVLLTIQWSDPLADNKINSATEAAVASMTAKAKALGVFNDFVYLNYALESQDPIASYGTANVAALKAASKKYDPNGVFQTLVPGGYKLSR